jgi:phage baseplate assembly protein W
MQSIAYSLIKPIVILVINKSIESEGYLMAIRGTNIGFSTVERNSPPFTIEGFDLAKRDLQNAFGTRRGERVMRPDFGTIIHDLLFEPFDEDTQAAITEDAVRIISQDPRLQLVDMDVRELEHTVRLDIILNYVPLDVVESLSIEYDRQNIEAQ